MKKILFLSYGEFFPFKGGVANYVENIADSLSRYYKIIVAAPFIKNKKEQDKYKTYRPRLTKFNFLRKIVGNLYSLFLYFKYNPEIVIITDQISLSLINLLFFFKKKSTITYYIVYGTEILDIKNNQGLVSFNKMINLSKKINKFITISQYSKKLFKNNFPEIKTKPAVYYPKVSNNFVSLTYSDKEERDILNKYSLEKNKYVLSIGRLVKRKGHHLVKPPKDLKYVVVGTGPEFDNLSKNKSIILTSEVNEKTKKILLANCLFYIQPSIAIQEKHQQTEGFGISIIEAFSLKKTVVAFNHGGISEIIKNNINGVIVSENNQKELNESINFLYLNPKIRKKLEERAIIDFRNNFFGDIGLDIEKYKPKIVYIVEWFYPIIGGAGKQALLQAKYLNSKYNISILTRRVINSKEKDNISNIPVFRFGNQDESKFNDYLSGLMLFLNLVKNQKNIDLIHIHGNLENNFSFFAILFSKLFNKPVIGKLAVSGELKNHLDSKRYSRFQIILKNLNPLNWLRRYTAKKLNYYIAISQEIKQELDNIIKNKEKIKYIPNGIDINKNYIRTNKNNNVVFLTVSRLVKHKGIINPLLSVWKNYFKNNNKVKLVIVGSGEPITNSIENEVKNYVKNNKLNNVFLVGKKENIINYLKKSDIFILPSENEGLSNSLLEAINYRLLCIVTNVSGNKDLITNNYSGYIFNKNNPNDLKEKILLALNNKNQWAKFTDNAFDNLSNKYSINKVCNNIEKIYTKVLNQL